MGANKEGKNFAFLAYFAGEFLVRGIKELFASISVIRGQFLTRLKSGFRKSKIRHQGGRMSGWHGGFGEEGFRRAFAYLLEHGLGQ
jgi:hypothetical protein